MAPFLAAARQPKRMTKTCLLYTSSGIWRGAAAWNSLFNAFPCAEARPGQGPAAAVKSAKQKKGMTVIWPCPFSCGDKSAATQKRGGHSLEGCGQLFLSILFSLRSRATNAPNFVLSSSYIGFASCKNDSVPPPGGTTDYQESQPKTGFGPEENPKQRRIRKRFCKLLERSPQRPPALFLFSKLNLKRK